MKKIARNIAGVLLLLLGVLGIFLPLLQGFLFIALGIGMLDFERKTWVLARLRRGLRHRGVPRKLLMYPSHARRARRIEKRRQHKLRDTRRLDLEKVID